MTKNYLQSNKKANITFLVLMIMFISSLLGLLVSQYIQYMIQTASIFQNYYATYYLAYGGLELGLTQVKYHGYGFEENIITTGSSCRTPSCSTTTDIQSLSPVIANSYDERTSCSELKTNGGIEETYMQLGSGDCFIVPLYKDIAQGFDAIDYEMISSTDFLGSPYNPTLNNGYLPAGAGTGEVYSIRIIDESLSNLDSFLEPTTASPGSYAFGPSMSPYSGNAINYLIIANPTSTTKEFCLELASSNTLPMKYVTVTSIAQDGDNTIALNGVKNNELPSFLCYGAINP